MKTLRLSTLLVIAVASASAALAGPGIEYWNARRNPVKEQAPVVTNVPAPDTKCEKMPVTIGKFTKTVECSGSVTDTAACKGHCANR